MKIDPFISHVIQDLSLVLSSKTAQRLKQKTIADLGIRAIGLFCVGIAAGLTFSAVSLCAAGSLFNGILSLITGIFVGLFGLDIAVVGDNSSQFNKRYPTEAFDLLEAGIEDLDDTLHGRTKGIHIDRIGARVYFEGTWLFELFIPDIS